MKISNGSSLLFVKQDLFAKLSPNKASFVSGKELDSAIVADRNKFDRDIFGDSYSVDINSDANNTNIRKLMYYNGDYDYDDSIWSKSEAIDSTEVYIGEVFKSYNKTGSEGVFRENMNNVARSLNTYSRFQTDTNDLKDDAYLQSLQDRFDIIDPNGENALVSQMRNMVSTIQNGGIISITDKKFTTQVEALIGKPEENFHDDSSDIAYKDDKNKDKQAELVTKKKQSYTADIVQTKNDADMLSKLLNNDEISTSGQSLKDIANINTDTERENKANARKTSKLLQNLIFKDDNRLAQKTKNQKNDELDKSSLTKSDWMNASHDYAKEHKDISDIYRIYSWEDYIKSTNKKVNS